MGVGPVVRYSSVSPRYTWRYELLSTASTVTVIVTEQAARDTVARDDARCRLDVVPVGGRFRAAFGLGRGT